MTRTVETYDEFKTEIEKGGFILAHWDGTPETEEKNQGGDQGYHTLYTPRWRQDSRCMYGHRQALGTARDFRP